MRHIPLPWILAALAAACGGVEADGEDTDTREGDAIDEDASADPPAETDVPDLADSAADPADDDAPPAACAAEALGARLGRTQLMVGGAMDDGEFDLAPFDLRYHYVAGDVPDAPCASCASGCFARGSSCAGGGCPWWGCWQWDALPPGRFVADFVASTAGSGAVPMITYYIWFSVAGDVEGSSEVAALADAARTARYLADFRFLCQVIDESPTVATIVHVEPDLWGYGHQVSDDPATIPAAVSAASDPSCAGLPDTMVGLVGCMLAIARDEAPSVLVAFHASAWGAGADALMNSDAGFDLSGHALETSAFMRALGAAQGDLVVVEMSDRDAGFNDRWWDPTNAALPHFHQAIDWASTMADDLGLAHLWWQIPYGHTGLENVCDRYEDNRVDYFFDNPGEFAGAGALGIAFGAGAGCMTTPATDDGHFVDRASAYLSGTRPPLCGD